MSSELEEYSKPKIKRIKLEDLAPEDMVKRQRRRERNKVAATKCRNKKKARTVNLMKVSTSTIVNLMCTCYTIYEVQ